MDREATKAVAQMIYELNLPFAIADSDAFKKAFRLSRETSAKWQPPGSEIIRTTVLTETVDALSRDLEPLRGNWQRYGCSIMSDGWTDTRRRPILNILVSCCMGTQFLRAVDCSRGGAVITGEYMWEVIRAAIVTVGPENVVQVVTDNASNCVDMARHLRAEFPYIVHTPCAAHGIDLLMGDIGSLEWVRSTTELAMFLVTFVTRKRRVLAMFRSFSSLDLRKPAPTRFAFDLVVIDRLIRCRPQLRQMVAGDRWAASSFAQTPDGIYFATTVFGDEFWRGAEQLATFLRPFYIVLRLVDSEGSTLGLLYELMDRIGQFLQTPVYEPAR